ncbi:hypothetical protein ATN38_04375 [Rhodococcus sp. FH8]|uniref:Uncharacterized protein n=1 Tax=Rhodococcus erythropolis TaxID=1833 RepID=A0A1Q4JSQ6_RHOER|nr:hypothetical protein RHOER0001_0286 [Rhodococcus erythropolis SK121]KDQ03563.1 hypothetical protein EN35_01680 [Rhodococcus qingshengii]KZF15382.1 hypothetical protein A2J01_31040 [Rhodococcus sp. EPR-134]MBW0286032.1 hypothetical protein [Rhodococcus sp. FH8]OKA10735.1 hypothetical protein BS618_29270 [Rhodococcus erythropolis]
MARIAARPDFTLERASSRTFVGIHRFGDLASATRSPVDARLSADRKTSESLYRPLMQGLSLCVPKFAAATVGAFPRARL